MRRKQSIIKRLMRLPSRYRRLGKQKQRYIRLNLGVLAAIFLLLTVFAESQPQEQETPPLSETEYSEAQFIAEVGQAARDNYPASHVLPSIVTAQAILESNFGKSELSQSAYNLFGRKAYGNEPSITLPTKEVIDGQTITINARFKVYPNYQAAIIDHGTLMTAGVNWNPNLYQGVVDEPNYKRATKALQQAGYATDPDYDNKLNQLIETYQLTQYDP